MKFALKLPANFLMPKSKRRTQIHFIGRDLRRSERKGKNRGENRIWQKATQRATTAAVASAYLVLPDRAGRTSRQTADAARPHRTQEWADPAGGCRSGRFRPGDEHLYGGVGFWCQIRLVSQRLRYAQCDNSGGQPTDASDGPAMVDYAHRYPSLARALAKVIGHQVDGSDETYRRIAEQHIPFVEFHVQ
jgi:hypothetical protein